MTYTPPPLVLSLSKHCFFLGGSSVPHKGKSSPSTSSGRTGVWWRIIVVPLATLILALISSSPARADDLRPGYLDWTQQSAGQWAVTWKAPLLGGLATRAKPLLPKGCTVRDTARRLAGSTLIETARVRCDESLAGREIGLEGIESSFSDALVRVAPLGRPVQAGRLTPDAPRLIVATKAERGQVATSYFVLGIEHILLGFDHLLFVIGLVLLIRRGRQVVTTVTMFTLAHSLTLALVTLGWFAVSRRPLEVCIALSIVFLAREIVRPDGAPSLAKRLPGLVAFVFGLLHGLGFAAALAEIGLPQGELPLALLTFNLGVETGQLAVVAVTFAVLALIARLRPPAVGPVRHAAAYAIGIMASFWMFERALAA